MNDSLFSELVEAALRESASPDQLRALNQILGEDPDRLDEFLSQVRIDTLLHQKAPAAAPVIPRFRWGRSLRRAACWALAAAGLAWGGAAFFLPVKEPAAVPEPEMPAAAVPSAPVAVQRPAVRPLAAAVISNTSVEKASARTLAAVPAVQTKGEDQIMNLHTAMTAVAASTLAASSALGVSAPVRNARALEAEAAITTNTAAPIFARILTDGRSWQTVFTSGQPIRWRWPDGVDCARLVVTGCMERAAADSGIITRADGELYGSYPCALFPSASVKKDSLYLLTIHYFVNDAETNRETATLLFQAGANNRGIQTRLPETKEWIQFSDVVAVPYDAAWLESTADAGEASLTAAYTAPSGAVTVTRPLSGVSGFEPFDPKDRLAAYYGSFRLALNFDVASAAWLANLERIPHGTIFTFN